MEFIAQQALRRDLKRRYKVPTRDYFWDALDHLGQFNLPARAAWRRLTDATASVIAALGGRPPFVLFTDRLAGWRDVAKRHRRSPVRSSSLEEALAFLQQRAHFRDPRAYEDNYYLCDRSLAWFIVFCHHGDWHLFVPPSVTQRQRFRRWQVQAGARPAKPVQEETDGEDGTRA